MTSRVLQGVLFALSLLMLVVACVRSAPIKYNPTLSAPGGASAQAVASVKQGNQQFAAGLWGAAKAQYELAIQVQPDLAEAHYNLALVLDQMGDETQARAHYIKAANLAPGHKVIWNSRILRPYEVKGSVSVGEDDLRHYPGIIEGGKIGGIPSLPGD